MRLEVLKVGSKQRYQMNDEIYGYSPEKDIWAHSQNCLTTQTAVQLCQKEKYIVDEQQE